MTFLLLMFLVVLVVNYEWAIHSGRLRWVPREKRNHHPRTVVEGATWVRGWWRREPRFVLICVACLICCLAISTLAALLVT